MAIESRPGMAASIPLGHNYAQPSISPHAVPEGHQLQRALWWAGDRNTGCFLYDTNLLGFEEYSKRFGPEVSDTFSATASPVTDTIISALKRKWDKSIAAMANKDLNEARLVSNIGNWAAEYE